eukprot:COSAG03_NODE_384_length_8325_cov_50.332726_10_plen_284_part_00
MIIWGSWNGIVPADGEALRRSAHILRFFGRLGFTQSPGWEPHAPEVLQSHAVFGSRWPLGEETLWTLVNRGSRNVSGAQLRLQQLQSQVALHYYDCYHGTPLHPTTFARTTLSSSNASAGAGAGDGMGSSDTGTIAIDTIELSFPIEGLGFGCVFATPANPQRQPFDNNGISRNLSAFLAEMAAMTARPLSSYEKEWRPLPQTIDPVPRTQPTTLLYSMLSNASESEQQLQQEQQPPPHGMVLVRGTARYEFLTTGVEVEGGQNTTKASQIVDVMFPWESAPR